MDRIHKNTWYGISSMSNCHLFDVSEAVMSIACCNQVTSTFPKYPLPGKVMKDIISLPKITWWWKQSSKYTSTSWREYWFYDIQIIFYGRKYLCYCQETFQLPSGFSIYKSLFWNSDDSREVNGGPHQILNNSGKYYQFKVNSLFQFFSNQYQLYRK